MLAQSIWTIISLSDNPTMLRDSLLSSGLDLIKRNLYHMKVAVMLIPSETLLWEKSKVKSKAEWMVVNQEAVLLLTNLENLENQRALLLIKMFSFLKILILIRLFSNLKISGSSSSMLHGVVTANL